LALQGFQCYPGFECCFVSSSFRFHFQWFFRLLFYPNALAFYSLTTGPIFGGHLKIQQ
jgi:hypothetical protein